MRTEIENLKLILARCRRVNGCLLWLGYVDKDGYGRFGFQYKLHHVHRFLYEAVKGPVPKGMVVMHSCDTPNCVEIEHLSVGTPWDNLLDARRKLHYNCGKRHERT